MRRHLCSLLIVGTVACDPGDGTKPAGDSAPPTTGGTTPTEVPTATPRDDFWEGSCCLWYTDGTCSGLATGYLRVAGDQGAVTGAWTIDGGSEELTLDLTGVRTSTDLTMEGSTPDYGGFDVTLLGTFGVSPDLTALVYLSESTPTTADTSSPQAEWTCWFDPS